MEPFSTGLLICGVSVSMYQMSGTPFILNIIIFCVIMLICLYAMIVSQYRLPSDALFHWIYSKKGEGAEDNECQPFDQHDDQITKKLRELTGHIVRDFILSWYNAVTDDVAFVQEAFELFEHLLTEARMRVSQSDKERLLTNILSEFLHHVTLYKKAADQVETRGTDGSEERRNQLVAIAYYSESKHPAFASLPDSEMEYLRGIVAFVLKGLLPEDYNLNETPLYLVRELIAQNVVNSIINLTSDPLWLYNTIADILDEETNSENVSCSTRDIDALETDAEQEIVDVSSHDGSDGNDNDASVYRDEAVATSSQNCTSVSHSSSVASQFSNDSQDLSELSTMNQDDIPLPLLSSVMHFAPDQNKPASNNASLTRTVTRPNSDRLFYHIRINEYTIMKENFDANKKYALYKISFRTKEKGPSQTPPIDIPTSESVSSQTNSITSEEQEETFTRYHQVQRRFREFLVLQERLSQNMVAKNLLGEIKGPSRMFPVPFGNMDKEYIEQRRKFLQAYLRKICSIPFISKTKEMKEFLAYEMDPRIAYVKKPDSIPRFDEIFKSAIQDLFGSAPMKFSNTFTSKDFSQAFQTEDDPGPSSASTDPFPSAEVSNIGAVTKLKNKVFGMSKHHVREKSPSVKTSRQYASFERNRPVTYRWKREDEIEASFPNPVSDTFHEQARGLGDGCDAPSATAERIICDVSPPSLLLRLVLKVWPVTPGRHGLTTVALLKYIEGYLSDKVAELTTKQSWTKYLDVLHKALWPRGEWESSQSVRQTWATTPDQAKNKTLTRFETCLKQALPGALQLLMSEKDYDTGVKLLVESLQNVNINRQFIYRLLDLVALELFPDLDEVYQRINVSLSNHTSKS